MNTKEIIDHICSETGIDFRGTELPDFVPLNDLNIHKTEVWNLTITEAPELYFLKLKNEYRYKIGYRFKYPIENAEQGIILCQGISRELGLQEVEIPVHGETADSTNLYLAIHIHPEFLFTPKTKVSIATTARKMCFV